MVYDILYRLRISCRLIFHIHHFPIYKGGYGNCGRSKFLSKFLKILVKKIREIFPETGTYFFDKFTEKNRDLGGYQFRLNNGVPEYKAGADAVWVPFKSPELITCKSGLSGIKVTITKTGTYIIVASRGGLRSGNVYVTVSGSEVTKIDHTLANNGGWLWSITSDVYEGMLNTGTTITVTGESKEDGVTAPVSMIVYKL